MGLEALDQQGRHRKRAADRGPFIQGSLHHVTDESDDCGRICADPLRKRSEARQRKLVPRFGLCQIEGERIVLDELDGRDQIVCG